MAGEAPAQQGPSRSPWRWVAWVLVAAYMGGIFYASSRPSLSALPAPDYVLHGLAYGGLGFLVHLALAAEGWAPGPAAVAALAWVGLYGLSDELHQAFVPGRTPSVTDLLADFTGGSLVQLALLALRRLWPGRRGGPGPEGGPRGRRPPSAEREEPVRRAGRGLLVGLLAGLLALALWTLGAWQALELVTVDSRFAGRWLLGLQPPVSPSHEPVVVAIDDAALARYGPWPWPRALQAQLIESVARAGATTIGLDLILSEPSRQPGDDQRLASTLRHVGRVVLAAQTVSPGAGTSRRGRGPGGAPVGWPLPALATAAAGVGHIHVQVDADGVIRRLPLWVLPGSGGQAPVPALALVMVKLSGGLVPEQAAARPHQLWLDYRLSDDGRPSLAAVVSAADVMAGRASGLSGRPAVIGVTAAGLVEADRHLTPFRRLGPVAGVFIHATAVRTLQEGMPLRQPGAAATAVLTLLLGALAGLAWASLSPAAGLAGLAAGLVVWMGLGLWAFARAGLLLELVPPAMAMVGAYGATALTAYRRLALEAARVRDAFGRHVAPEVVEEILRHPEAVHLKPERRRVTVLFADLRGFTARAEGAPPDCTFAVLNRYLALMAHEVLARRGTVDKFVGDAVMAVFGAPVAHPDPDRAAVEAALAIQRRVQALAAELESEGWGLAVGIGIHAGEVVVGHVGTAKRVEYTAIGDAVNVAARLEDAAGPGQILLSDQVRVEGYPVEELGPVQLAGRRWPVRVYLLRADARPTAPTSRDWAVPTSSDGGGAEGIGESGTGQVSGSVL